MGTLPENWKYDFFLPEMKISFDVTGLRAGIGTKGTFNGSTLTLTFPKWFCHTPTKAEFPLATWKPQKPSFLSLSDSIFIVLKLKFPIDTIFTPVFDNRDL